MINGPARCLDGIRTFYPETQEFKIHKLEYDMPICGFETRFKFIEMAISIDKIADWKKCPKCFK